MQIEVTYSSYNGQSHKNKTIGDLILKDADIIKLARENVLSRLGAGFYADEDDFKITKITYGL